VTIETFYPIVTSVSVSEQTVATPIASEFVATMTSVEVWRQCYGRFMVHFKFWKSSRGNIWGV